MIAQLLLAGKGHASAMAAPFSGIRNVGRGVVRQLIWTRKPDAIGLDEEA